MSDALLEHVTRSIEAGSKSFAAASRLFAPDVRRSALMLYAWCRHCDDVIDGQSAGFNSSRQAPETAQAALASLVQETRRAYAGETMHVPAFAAFQDVALRHCIPQAYAFAHLSGFEMDVLGQQYLTIDDTLDYCYRVAGVVGLMMAKVMGVDDEATLDRACDLGLAFQLTNIARDLCEDAAVGRCYVPQDWLLESGLRQDHITLPEARAAVAALAVRLINYAEPYYRSADAGIPALPLRSAWAVAAASNVYREIGIKLLARAPEDAGLRASTTRTDKLRLIAVAGAFALRTRGQTPAPRPANLWRRPQREPLKSGAATVAGVA